MSGLVARACKKAEGLGKSGNQLIRDHLQSIAGGDDPEASIAEFRRLSAKAIPVAGVFTATKSMSRGSSTRTARLYGRQGLSCPADPCRRVGKEHQRSRTAVVSLQGLQEYFVTVTRKRNIEAGLARRKVERLSEFDVDARRERHPGCNRTASLARNQLLGRPRRPIREAEWLQRAFIGKHLGTSWRSKASESSTLLLVLVRPRTPLPNHPLQSFLLACPRAEDGLLCRIAVSHPPSVPASSSACPEYNSAGSATVRS